MVRTVGRLTVLVIASVIILATIVHFVGFESTFAAISEAGTAAFIAPGIILGLFIVVQALTLKVLGKPIGHRTPLWTLTKAVTAGLAASIITPSTYLGGEPVKILYLGGKTSKPYREVAGTVVLAKYLEALAFVLILGLSIGATALGFGRSLFTGANLPLGIGLTVVAAVAVALGVLLWLSLAKRWTFLTWLVGVGARVFRRGNFMKRLCVRTRQMEYQVSRVFVEEGEAVLGALALFVLANVLFFSRPLIFFFLGWRIGLRFSVLSLIFVTSQVLLAGQLTPSAVGTLDGGLLAVVQLAELPISAAQCAAFLLCLRFWDAIVVVIGAGLGARIGIRIFSKRDEAGPSNGRNGGMSLLWGRVRRIYLNVFRKSYVQASLARRHGACLRCGACCRMGIKCRFLMFDADGLSGCKVYDRRLSPNCKTFPIDERDLADRDKVMPDRPCGYVFSARPGSPNARGARAQAGKTGVEFLTVRPDAEGVDA